MSEVPFYRPIDAKLCQGDIFERVPQAFTREFPLAIKKATLPGKRAGYEELGPLSGEARQLIVPANCEFTRAMLLNYDCEIDKRDAKLLTLVLVRPIDPTLPDETKRVLRGNGKFSLFYLTPEKLGDPESCIDFRRLSTVGIDALRTTERLTRLSETAVKAMLFQFFRYLTRIDLNFATLPAPKEEG